MHSTNNILKFQVNQILFTPPKPLNSPLTNKFPYRSRILLPRRPSSPQWFNGICQQMLFPEDETPSIHLSKFEILVQQERPDFNRPGRTPLTATRHVDRDAGICCTSSEWAVWCLDALVMLWGEMRVAAEAVAMIVTAHYCCSALRYLKVRRLDLWWGRRTIGSDVQGLGNNTTAFVDKKFVVLLWLWISYDVASWYSFLEREQSGVARLEHFYTVPNLKWISWDSLNHYCLLQ